MTDQIPFRPINGRILVKQLPYKPSKILECISIDKADQNEGIVVAVSDYRIAYKVLRDSKGRVVGREATGPTFAHEVKVGDRVFFPGSYQDDDVMAFNGEKYRCMEPWQIVGVMNAEQPQGFDHPVTGEKLSDKHPLLATA